MVHVTRMQLFPIKSFDGVQVKEAALRANGSLRHDREFRFVTADGNPVDSLARDDRLYKVRATFDDDLRQVQFSMPDHPGAPAPARFDLHHEPEKAGEWMSAALGKTVTLERNDTHGFCDDQEFAGPTIIGQGTLDKIADASGHTDVPRRLRANITLGDITPFAEDELTNAQRFTLGDATFSGASPCVRCKVPARNPETGAFDKGFVQRLVGERTKTSMHNPLGGTEYIASVNTMAEGEQVGRIALGDVLRVVEKQAGKALTHLR